MAETSPKEPSSVENVGSEPSGVRGGGLPGMRATGGGLPGMRASGDGEPSGALGVPRGPNSGSGPVVRAAAPKPLALPGLPPRPGDVIDEDQERWLIQKEDKMDYGPFSLRDVRAQIEKGTVTAEHNILDNETGERRRVADHALIGAMAREWTAKHAELDRQMKDQSERAKHRDAVLKLLSGIFAAVVVAGIIGGGVYYKFMKDKPVVVAKGPERPDPLIGAQFGLLKVDPPPPKKTHTKRKGPKNGAFDDTQTMDMSENEDVLSAEDIQKVMSQKYTLLTGCLRDEAARNPSVKKIDMDFLVKGNGSVSSVRVNGQTSSPVASCVFAKMQAITFPECKTCTKTHAAFSLSLK
ncbi:MAG: AgmX/PglI C-terminal domain-containing protein [Pseudoxanthomonas sp.]